MAGKLVIVESPHKAKVIGGYLGRGYTVRASMGHVRDLPKKGLGVDVESGSFAPQYEISEGKSRVISELRALVREADTVYLASDPDREGEAIAWHIAAACNVPQSKLRRVVFHEITKSAVQAAINNPRALDMNLIDAQQARRVLDRLMGYKLSPFLMNAMARRSLSAGRVQSVALRIIVEREVAIETFEPREYWTVAADLTPEGAPLTDRFRAALIQRTGKRWEFDAGMVAQAIVARLESGATWRMRRIQHKTEKRHPAAPFTTSTLQQEGSRKLGFGTKMTMDVAQELYEGVDLSGLPGEAGGTEGLITYMRTDSVNVAAEAQQAARDVIARLFGNDYVPQRPPHYRAKESAQEAHEAIRPTSPARTPESIQSKVSASQLKLYTLIWRRFIASQMSPAEIARTALDIVATPTLPAPSLPGGINDDALNLPDYPFRATGQRILFQGFLAVWGVTDDKDDTPRKGKPKEANETDDPNGTENKRLPNVDEGAALALLGLKAEQRFTQPPPRYGDAGLVKELEELGVGRPSTYSTILGTIEQRGYVVKGGDNPKDKAFHPTALGRTVNDVLVKQFPDLLDITFTAHMEEQLDEVAEGKRQWQPVIGAFYQPMMAQLDEALRTVDRGSVVVPDDGHSPPASHYKPKGYAARRAWKPKTEGGTPTRRANIATVEEATGIATKRIPAKTATPGASPACPNCGKSMVQRTSTHGTFWGCSGYPNCRGTLPGEGQPPKPKALPANRLDHTFHAKRF